MSKYQTTLQRSIDEYPEVQNTTGITNTNLGDAHGNALKIMYFLIEQGVCHLSRPQYQRFVAIYKTPIHKLTTANIQEFDALVEGMSIKNRDILVRFIGDELCDRGSNDYFTFKILTQLMKEKIPVEIMLSNHSLGFIEAFERGKNLNCPKLGYAQACSLYNLQYLIDTHKVRLEQVVKMVNHAYKPVLKALSYTIDPERNKITLISHAPIDIKVVKFLARKLGVPFADNSIYALAETIDAINLKFSKFTKSNNVHQLYDQEGIGSDPYEKPSDSNPFEVLTWNRNYNALNRSPAHKGYLVDYVHGHDSDVPSAGNVVNLDNCLGKNIKAHRGIYTVLSSDELHSKGHAMFLAQLKSLDQKREELRNRKEFVAAKKADDLFIGLQEKAQIYFAREANKDTYHDFKSSCDKMIEKSREELEKHRGWKEILGNIVLAIIGLGILFLTAGLVKGNFQFFRTDTAKKLQDIEESLEQFAPTAAAPAA